MTFFFKLFLKLRAAIYLESFNLEGKSSLKVVKKEGDTKACLSAVRSIRERNWQELKSAADAGGTHGLINNSGVWTFDSASDTPATGFTRKVEITGGGDSYQVVVTVSWTYGAKSFSSSSTTNFTLWKQ